MGSEGPRGRKEYSITEVGRTELMNWLTQTEPNRVRRDETLLRIFFLGNLTHDQATAYLLREAEVIKRKKEVFDRIEDTADWEANDIAIYGHLALEYGHRLMAMTLEWTDWAIAELDARQARGKPESGAGDAA